MSFRTVASFSQKLMTAVVPSASLLLLGVVVLNGVGCDKPASPPSSPTATPAETPADSSGEMQESSSAETTEATPAPAEPKRPNLVKRTTKEVLDKKKAMEENSNLVEVENKITAQDPLSASLQGYITIASRANVLNFQHQLNIMKAMNDGNPSYADVLQLLQQTNMDFNALPDYQYYAYDEQNGTFVILEDTVAKEKFFNQ